MQQISPRWVRQVLADRGITSPGLHQLESYIADLDGNGVEALQKLLRSIQIGVESSTDLQDFLERVHAIVVPEQAGRVAETPPDAAPLPVARARAKPAKSALSPSIPPLERPWVREHGVHIYGGKAAMKVELDTLRSDVEESVRYTVQVEMASATAPRTYDWTKKIAFQFTRRELPLLAVRLLGYSAGPLRLTNHGPDHDKQIEIRDQGNSMFVVMKQGARTLALPVEPADVYQWLAIALVALQKNHPELDGTLLLELVKRTGQIVASPAHRPHGAPPRNEA
jgi:hypothetical protein